MFDQLLKLVEEHAGDAIVNNSAIPNEKNNDAMKATTNSIINSLKKQQNSAGGQAALASMFSGGGKDLSKAVEGNLVGDLMKNFGVDNKIAGDMVGKMLPGIMQKFVSKTNDPSDSSFDLGSIMSYLK